jgi:hypothetical protein
MDGCAVIFFTAGVLEYWNIGVLGKRMNRWLSCVVAKSLFHEEGTV